ncbi:hypothetical protein QBC36DRAFT_361006 [Triangularia setosa]|uniref:CN hydrolase domain-containing protein n=1 Tax=Triangularia setosa TaxID=2587417 RepID=A0AAN6W0R6_9PEZI|nr:hypothetical protein QBC36DRAFT_361006 [Podospora setosa]
MKIACLQFAPQVGDVDNNLNRADAVLNKIRPGDLANLDLLVLPELAFSGYNFSSLQHISPCLERQGSGISSLWARTTALKHDCAVVVGYPEKVDVNTRWPANPEYYNSALIVNRDGDTVGNYRKLHLYYTDETWALQGRDGFYQDSVSGLGDIALGICTDINPYELETPWDAFEFGFHVMEAQAKVVIVTMAWQSQQNPSQYTRRPDEPDLEALVYWVQRLEPLIRSESGDEIIVVFCNRTGVEDDVMYTGTSAVLGIKGGEVFVYGVLGRGVKELLLVDTDLPPISKLTDASGVEAENPYAEETDVETEPVKRRAQALEIQIPAKERPKEPPISLPISSRVEAIPATPMSASSARLPWLAPAEPDAQSPGNPRSPTRLQIPITPVRPVAEEFTLIDSAIAEDMAIPTASSSRTPSPDRKAASRPSRLSIPTTPWRFRDKASPYPWQYRDGSQSAVFGGGACMTPITPFEVEEGWLGTPIDAKPPNWYWKHDHSLSAVKEAIQEEEEVSPGNPLKSTQKVAGPSILPLDKQKESSKAQEDTSLDSNKVRDATPIDTEPPNWYWKHEPTLSSLNEMVQEEPTEVQTEPEEEDQAKRTLAPQPPTQALSEDDVWVATPIDNEVPDWYWKHEPTLPALNETVQGEPEEDRPEAKQPRPSQPTQPARSTAAAEEDWVATPIDEEPPDWYWKHEQTLSSLNESALEEQEEEEEPEQPSPQPSSPLDITEPHQSSDDWAELSSVLASFKIHHPKSALSNGNRAAVGHGFASERPSSPKSRNASRSKQIYSSMESYNWAQQQLQSQPSTAGSSIPHNRNPSIPKSQSIINAAARRPSSRLRQVISANDDLPDIDEDDTHDYRGRNTSVAPYRYRSVSRGRQPGPTKGVRGVGTSVERSGSRRRVLLQQKYVQERQRDKSPEMQQEPEEGQREQQRQDQQQHGQFQYQYQQHKPSIDYSSLPNWPFPSPPSPSSSFGEIGKAPGTSSALSVVSGVTVDDDDLHNPETPRLVARGNMGMELSPSEEYDEYDYGHGGGEKPWNHVDWAGSASSLLNEEWEGRRHLKCFNINFTLFHGVFANGLTRNNLRSQIYKPHCAPPVANAGTALLIIEMIVHNAESSTQHQTKAKSTTSRSCQSLSVGRKEQEVQIRTISWCAPLRVAGRKNGCGGLQKGASMACWLAGLPAPAHVQVYEQVGNNAHHTGRRTDISQPGSYPERGRDSVHGRLNRGAG